MCGGAGVIAAMYAIGKLKPKLNVIGVIPSSENLPGPQGDEARRHPARDERQDDRSDQHRRRRPPDPGRRAVLRARTRRDEDRRRRHAHRRVRGRARPRRQRRDVQQRRVRRAVPHRRRPTSANATGVCRSTTISIVRSRATSPTSRIPAAAAAGAETAGAFLQNFVADVPWIHLDIAGTAYLDGESPFMAKGPTGTPVRAFVALVEDLAKSGFSTNGKPKSTAAAKKVARRS